MSCPALQLALLVNVLEMQADVLLGCLKKLRHVLLREPEAFARLAWFTVFFATLRLCDFALIPRGDVHLIRPATTFSHPMRRRNFCVPCVLLRRFISRGFRLCQLRRDRRVIRG